MVDIRKLIVTLALKLSGIEYIWGGSSPRYGFDCSGFVIWILQVFGLLPAGDWTAGTLSKAFQETSDYQPGNLVFYGKDRDRIYHVMMYVGEMGPMGHSVIGASGGDSTTTTIDEAHRRNAQVKLKPIDYRKDRVVMVNVLMPTSA